MGLRKSYLVLAPKILVVFTVRFTTAIKCTARGVRDFHSLPQKKQTDLLIYILNFIDIVISAPRTENGDIFCKLDIVNKPHKSFVGLDFGKALATLARSCYTDFTPAQIQQIKEILEG